LRHSINGRSKYRVWQQEVGFTLLETLIAVAIIGVVAVVFLSGLDTTSKNTRLYNDHITAANLAQSQVEAIRASAYLPDGSYPLSVSAPPGFEIPYPFTIVQGVDRQQITVNVNRDNRLIFKLTIVKTNLVN
jgi:prepilin-type N-terminal cleavage/methylation domain-containing protein